MSQKGISSCLTCLGVPEDALVVLSCSFSEYTAAELLTKYFWFKFDDLRDDHILCRTCWNNISNFHQFYLEVAHNHRKAEKLAAEENIEVIRKQLQSNTFVDNEAIDNSSQTLQVITAIEDISIRTETESDCYFEKSSVTKSKRKYVPRKGNVKKERKPISYQVKTTQQLAEEDKIIRTHVQYTCEECVAISPTFTSFQKHVKDTHGTKAFIVCCGRRYYKKVNLLEHVLQLDNPDLFKCDICFKSFINNHGVRRHKQQMHLPDDIKIYSCNRCPKRFAKQNHLSVHLKGHENLDNETAKCSECDKPFPSEALLKTHVKIRHTRPTDYICDVCAKGFYSKTEFLRHKKEHELSPAALRVQCDICRLWFRSRIHLNDHKRRHKQPPVTCDLCGHTSPNKKALASHKRLRHGESSLICQECGKTFKRPITLREHMASHTGDALYSCSFCDRTFNSSANMFSHRKKMHPREWLQLRNAQLAERRGLVNSDRTCDWKLGKWNCRSLNFIGSTRILADLLKDRGFGIVALQEVCWTGPMVQTFRGDHTIYQSCGNTRELGTAFVVMGDMRKRVIAPLQTESQIDHVLIDGRHFSDIIEVRTYRGANVDSDHYLMMVKLRLSVINNARYQLPPRYNIERLKQPDVASAYAQNLEAALPDEECRVILKEKNAARAVMLQHGTRQNVERYKQRRKEQTRIFLGEKTPPGSSGVRGNGTAVPLSRNTALYGEPNIQKVAKAEKMCSAVSRIIMDTVRPCLTCFRKTDNYMRITDETNADDVERIVTTHFWFSENECFDSVLCTSCWEKIDDFHKFYSEVKRAHLELTDAVEMQIKVEPFENTLGSVKREGVQDEKNITVINVDTLDTTDVLQEPESSSEVKDELKIEDPTDSNVKKTRRNKKRRVNLSESEPESVSKSETVVVDQGKDVSATDDSDWEPPHNDDSADERPKKKQRRPRTVKKQPKKKYTPRKPRKPCEERSLNAKTKEDIAKEDEFIRRYCPIFCDKCDFNSDTFGELKAHTTTIHNSNPMVVCCEHKFYKRSFLYQHAQYHENPNKFKCEPCSKTFLSGLALKLHMDYTHVADEEKIYKCEICQASFAKHYHLTSHRMKHTSIAEKRFYCEPCDIAFRTNQSYRTHQHSKHGAAAKYVCDICARGFRQKSDLITHQLSHSAEGLEKLKIQCEHCHKWMKNKKSIWTHRRICQSAGPVACDICGKMAPNPEQLKSHKKFMHQDQRVHQCGYCEKAFKRPIDLKEHETIHTGEVLYTCNFCPKTFNSNSNLYSHRRKMHPIEYAEWKLALQLKKRPAPVAPADSSTSGALPELPTFLPTLLPTEGENYI
ncbi:uncharacterized protein LOC131428359 [Malaya genurostris]|uniref:uncharacterized protein LOC131428359 n=1 Tax=Malaya genurostris TaxID=325434 RepID=UPI0026F3E4DB|nr:uncharacterized protein LOC131428359 [Malaya genurostris]